MKPYMKRLVIVYIGFFLALNLVRCSSVGKLTPEYKGVDPQLQHFVKEYKELAKTQGISFKHEVTIGFKDLSHMEAGTVCGLTTYGAGWREIDIDPYFYNNSTETTNQILLFHELTHAYCYREHTWGNNDKYPEYSTWHGKEPTEGFYTDGTHCPLSIMYPYILDDFCAIVHYGNYVTEMFRNCQPY